MSATIRHYRAKRVAALVGLLLFSAVALAEDDIRRICSGELLVFDQPEFALFDIDTDTVLSEDETDACTTLQAVFEELDLDADETLTEQEYLAFPQIWRQRKNSFGDAEKK